MVKRMIALFIAFNFLILIKMKNKQKLYFLQFFFPGKLNATEAKNKFKNIRDTYRKIIHAEHRASGSAAVSSDDSWKFYQCCEFLVTRVY